MDTKKFILGMLSEVKRDGIASLINFVNDSSFFNDPASADKHNAYEGGLADHSLNVFNCLNKYCKSNLENNNDFEKIIDSIAIVGLLHDIGYTGCFQKTSKNVPMKGSDGKNKKSEYGKLIFIEKESYEFNPEAQLPYPHGLLSTIILKKHIKLSNLENLAILWQSGSYDQPQHMWSTVDRAMKTHKLIMYTQFAKKEATLFYDKRLNNGSS